MPLILVMEEELYVVEGRVKRVRYDHPEPDALREVARRWLEESSHRAEREHAFGKGTEGVDEVLAWWTEPVEEWARELLDDILYHDELSENQQFILGEVFNFLDLFVSEGSVDLIPIIRECHRVLTRREHMRERERARVELETKRRLPKRGSTARRKYAANRLLELAPPLIARGLSNRKIARKMEAEVGSSERTVRNILGELQRKGGLPRPKVRVSVSR